MRLEVIDSEDPSYYWVAIITEIYAGRLRLQYRGTDDSNGELWCYYLWERLHHPGYGRRNGLALRPPRSTVFVTVEKFVSIMCQSSSETSSAIKGRYSIDNTKL